MSQSRDTWNAHVLSFTVTHAQSQAPSNPCLPLQSSSLPAGSSRHGSLLPNPPPHIPSPGPSRQEFMLANAELAEEVVQANEKLTLLGMMRETRSLFAEEPTANPRAQATVVFIYSEPYLISRSLDLQVAGQAVRKFQNEASGLIWVCFSIRQISQGLEGNTPTKNRGWREFSCCVWTTSRLDSVLHRCENLVSTSSALLLYGKGKSPLSLKVQEQENDKGGRRKRASGKFRKWKRSIIYSKWIPMNFLKIAAWGTILALELLNNFSGS